MVLLHMKKLQPLINSTLINSPKDKNEKKRQQLNRLFPLVVVGHTHYRDRS